MTTRFFRAAAISSLLASALVVCAQDAGRRPDLHLLPRGKAAVIFADLAPRRTAPPSFGPVTHMGGWDAYARSIVVDLGRVQRIDAVDMVATRPTLNEPHVDGVQLLVSVDNREYMPVPADFELARTEAADAIYVGSFRGFTAYGRYVKIHNPYEGSETGFASRDAAEMPRIYSAEPNAALPDFVALAVPGWVVSGRVPVDVRVTGATAGMSLRATLGDREIPVARDAASGRVMLDLSSVAPGDAELALALHIGDNPFPVARTWRVLSVFENIHTAIPPPPSGLPEPHAVRLTDMTAFQEGAPGHVITTPYRTATGLSGTWVVPHKHQSDGFVIRWPHPGRFAIIAGITPRTTKVSAQFGADAPVQWTFSPDAESGPECLRELFLGTFGCEHDAVRIRLGVTATVGGLAYLKIRHWRNPLAQTIPDLHDERRVILDNDGYSAFCIRMMETPDAMARYSALYRDTRIRGVVWCVGNLLEVNYDSETAPTMFEGVNTFAAPSHAKVRNAVETYIRSGEDTLAAHLRIMRDNRLQALTSLRVQRVPSPTYDKDRTFPFYDTHKRWRIYNRNGQLLRPLSYANPGVRDRALKLIDEVLARGPDVFLLELTRGVPFVGYHPDLIREYRRRVPGPELTPPEDGTDPRWLEVKNGPMTTLMRAVRKRADAHGARLGKPILVGAHVDNMGFRTEGVDLAGWVDEGLIDVLVAGIGQGSDTITPVLEAAERREVPVYGHIHAHFGGKDPTPDEERARAQGQHVPQTGGSVERNYFLGKAYRFYSQGAVGMYVWDGFFYPAVADDIGNPDRVAQWYWLERPTRTFRLPVERTEPQRP